MTVRALVALALGANSLILAADGTKQSTHEVKTERLDFPAGGVLRVKNSTGELTVEGWDRPEIEVTTVKSSGTAHGSAETEKASPQLDRVHVASERRGDEVVIVTTFSPRRTFPPPSPLKGGIGVNLDYQIKVPHQARLVVEHGVGEVHIDDVSGDIHTTVLKGGITLRLPQEEKYAIDAKSDMGGVVSDFPGRAGRRFWLVGHRFFQEAAPPAHKLYLRVGSGDITILKMQQPLTPAPLARR